jgi:hypothetical protein
MMRLSLKQAIVLVVVIAALLVALLGGAIRIAAAQGHLSSQHSGMHATHQLAWYCPAPPVTC